ncbi:hypothetical protein [Plantactinospora soyae]|uniref:Uncharacterized protein n=1 Tax=Plantactinospora soyae TaxID=1544732 RepID=A0A927M5H9_9ACTN|nr:hypothetical protein [Plantactinospora soyae]MBE1487347.1 hypothetical protein [Plantactinospora soyae]
MKIAASAAASVAMVSGIAPDATQTLRMIAGGTVAPIRGAILVGSCDGRRTCPPKRHVHNGLNDMRHFISPSSSSCGSPRISAAYPLGLG